MINLFNKITEWQEKTFSETTKEAVAKHLLKESNELLEAIQTKTDEEAKEELADNFILLFNLTKKMKMNYWDLVFAIENKHFKNLSRKWKAPDADGCVHHEK
jgi:NTP pyrophosphatase (non-canonical NTP hydrolase)